MIFSYISANILIDVITSRRKWLISQNSVKSKLMDSLVKTVHSATVFKKRHSRFNVLCNSQKSAFNWLPGEADCCSPAEDLSIDLSSFLFQNSRSWMFRNTDSNYIVYDTSLPRKIISTKFKWKNWKKKFFCVNFQLPMDQLLKPETTFLNDCSTLS